MNKHLLTLSAMLVLATGCASSMKKIGVIGTTEFYSVHSSKFDGPNFTGLVTHNTDTGEIRIPQTFGSGGIGSAVIAGAASVGSSAVLGISFPRNGDSVVSSTTNTDVSNSADTEANASNSNSNRNANSNINANSNSASGNVHPPHPAHDPKPPKEHGHH